MCSASEPSVARVVLVGFMCAGKTSVGAVLAQRLGWAHVDLDREIERGSGISIPEIFAARGEAGFRALEADATARIAARERVVVSTGGGWPTNGDCWHVLAPGAWFVWLRVATETVLARASREPGLRPLLNPPDPARVSELMARRAPFYARADAVFDVDDHGVAAIAAELERMLARRGGAAAAPPPST